MREIKFRGKSKNVNEWRYGTYIFTDNNRNDPFITRPFKESHRIVFWCSGDWNMAGWVDEEVIPETIGQYTGLKDKNGKEIYEGDILLIKEYKNNALCYFNYEEIKELSLEDVRGEFQRSYKTLIYYDEGCFVVYPININRCEMYISVMFGDMRCSQPIYEYEVIGNTYDNPELI